MQMIKIKTRAQARHTNSNNNLVFQISIHVEQQAVCEDTKTESLNLCNGSDRRGVKQDENIEILNTYLQSTGPK